MRINDLPNAEKPRERLIKYGASNLSNEDLISIILRTGTHNYNVKVLSTIVLSKIKSIDNLNNLTMQELTEIKGVGKVKAVTLMAAIELGKRVNNLEINEGVVIKTTETVHKYFSHLIANKNQEEILIILLDHKKRLISYNVMYKGTIDSSVVSIKEIFNYAIKEKASAFIMMHNHPSGVIVPSDEDKELTNNLIKTGKIIGIPLLDHLITNGKNYYSFFNEMVSNEA